jgi:Na+-transporting NADH:ubiquinone oxidoreductase subunit C
MQNKITTGKVLSVALVVSLVCSAVVTISTIMLRPVQEANRQHYMEVNILKVAGLLQEGVALKAQLQQLETHLVELDSGKFHEVEQPEAYDQRRAVKDPRQSIALSAAEDIAGIKRRARYAPVYLLRDDNGRVETIILPIHGNGLWSSLYGFIALQGDTKTVIGLRFYEHAETPGLGGEVDSTRWLAQWRGKTIFDSRWQPKIRLLKGGVDHDAPGTIHQVDALSGASVTSRGVENLLKFWLGDSGFGPFLARLRSSGGRL